MILAANPGFAQHWLVPRFEGLQAVLLIPGPHAGLDLVDRLAEWRARPTT